MQHRKGFTLIELLVVIAIIAILAAILFPVFAQAREKARQTSCLSNMKQIALAQIMYSQDYDETLPLYYEYEYGRTPFEFGTQDLIQPYVKNYQMFDCPSSGLHYDKLGYNSVQCSYGPNYPLIGHAVLSMAAIPVPADIFLFGESLYGWPYIITWQSTFGVAGWGGVSYRHAKFANFAFLDGHAKALTYDEEEKIVPNTEGRVPPYGVCGVSGQCADDGSWITGDTWIHWGVAAVGRMTFKPHDGPPH